jgi:hypothetical protein
MARGIMLASGHTSAATLRRLAFRLTIVLILSTLWSGDSPAQAASVLSLLFAAAVLWTAYATGERPTGPGLNRWHEGTFLAVLALVLFFWFGRGLASDRRSSVGIFRVFDGEGQPLISMRRLRLDGTASRVEPRSSTVRI